LLRPRDSFVLKEPSPVEPGHVRKPGCGLILVLNCWLHRRCYPG